MPGSGKRVSPSDFSTKILYKTLISPICATWPTHLIFLDLITRIIFGEGYRSLSSSLCSFLHSLLPRPSQTQMSLAPYSQTPYKYHCLSKFLIWRKLKRTWKFPYDIVLSPQYRMRHSPATFILGNLASSCVTSLCLQKETQFNV